MYKLVEILQHIEDFKAVVPNMRFAVFGEASLVLYALSEHCSVVDIAVSPKDHNTLLKQGKYKTFKSNDGGHYFNYNSWIRVHTLKEHKAIAVRGTITVSGVKSIPFSLQLKYSLIPKPLIKITEGYINRGSF